MTDSWFADALAASGFLRRYPQFAAMLAQMEPMATDAVASMAIARHWRGDGRVVLRLYVNRERLLAAPQFFAGTLQHEIHHVLCGHLDDPSFRQVEEPRWMELAMEFAANEHIVEPLPAVFRWQDYREFGMRPNQSTRERYDLLLAAVRGGRLRMLEVEELDRRVPGWRGRQAPGGASGAVGGPRVVVMPKQRGLLPWTNRPRVLDGAMADEHRPGARVGDGGSGIGDALDRARDGARAGTWQTSGWLSPPTDARQIAAWQLRIRAHLRGDAGGSAAGVTIGNRASKELPRQLAQLPGVSGLAWSRILRAVLRSPRMVRPTWLRPSRRFPERLGELQGRVRRPPRPRILVGLDTSASMSAAAMSLGLAEVRRLSRHADVVIAEVDAAVHRVHRDLRVEIVTGGGDTDFHPLFELGRAGAGFDAIVYCTDGLGAWPVTPPEPPVVWLLTGDRAYDCPWGLVVRMPA
ncbi:MAG: VWA-like domain-containing protein [Planctomycetota bacterium]